MNSVQNTLKHPVFLDAKIIETDIVWELDCENCGETHKIFTNTITLDPCCTNPKFKRTKQ